MKTIIRNPISGDPEGITDGELYLFTDSGRETDAIVAANHYSRKPTKNRAMSFRVRMAGYEGTGAVQLGYGIRPAKKGGVHPLITRGNYYEFDRMWLPDTFPKFSETRTIALLVSYLRQVRPDIRFLITYADGSAGNSGTIYRASNAIPMGSIPCDFYVLASGERVHPVSMYHRHKTRAWKTLSALYPGIRHIKGRVSGGPRQYRFLYILDRKLAKKI